MEIYKLGEYNFSKDISKGIEAEEYISKIILERDKSVLKIIPNENSKFDRMIIFKDGTFCTIEIKNDMLSKNTNNVAIETWCRGKDSGIMSSEADYFVYFAWINGAKKIFIQRRNVLLDFISKNNFKIVSGGDVDENGNPTTKMVLIPKHVFSNVCRDITNNKKYSFGIRRKQNGNNRRIG